MIKIETSEFPKSSDCISVTSVDITYTQENEVNSNNFDNLKLSIASNGAGFYFVMKTQRWAFNNIDEFILLLKDFQDKAKI